MLSRLEERMVKHRTCLDAAEAGAPAGRANGPSQLGVTFSESVNIAPLFLFPKSFNWF